jgi:hypothetical protein
MQHRVRLRDRIGKELSKFLEQIGVVREKHRDLVVNVLDTVLFLEMRTGDEKKKVEKKEIETKREKREREKK